MEENRPNPEELLKKLKREEEQNAPRTRGKLKIFLGYAAGVGKTYAMLEAAQGMKGDGIDVVAGYIEPHARPETTAMAEGLEIIPPLMVAYKGIELREFDLDAALKRKPKLLLVDELAHTNAAGLRHQKRYQDIEELLTAGINVYTTVNIQHLESLNDLVGNITGIHVKERIPDSVFDEADQVELVDIEPDDLIDRLKDGKIYKIGQAERALHNFFAREKLVALREIALRRMADRVNHLAEKEREASGNKGYFTGEHVLTCISPSPSCMKVVRAASRLAYAFHGEFTALYVETPALQEADNRTKEMLSENIRLAKALGAKIATVYGEDVAYQIAEYAKVSNVSKIVLGRTTHRFRFGQVKGSLSERISQFIPSVDVYIIPDFQDSKTDWKQKVIRMHRKKAADSGSSVGYYLLLMSGALAVSTAIGTLFHAFHLADSNIVMVYLLGIILIALYANKRIYSAIASLISVLLFNFFFTEPYFSLEAYDPSYLLTFIIMFVVGFITTSLVSKSQKHARENAKQAYRTAILLENSKKLRRAKSVQDVVGELTNQVLKLMKLSVIVYLNHNGRMVGPQMYPRQGKTLKDLNEFVKMPERTVAQWVMQNGRRAGSCTHTLPMANAIYLPVRSDDRVLAVLGIELEERREIQPFEYGLLTAMLNEAALVLERLM